MSQYVKLLASLSSLCLEVSSSVSGSFTLLFSVSVFFFCLNLSEVQCFKKFKIFRFQIQISILSQKKISSIRYKSPKGNYAASENEENKGEQKRETYNNRGKRQ